VQISHGLHGREGRELTRVADHCLRGSKHQHFIQLSHDIKATESSEMRRLTVPVALSLSSEEDMMNEQAGGTIQLFVIQLSRKQYRGGEVEMLLLLRNYDQWRGSLFTSGRETSGGKRYRRDLLVPPPSPSNAPFVNKLIHTHDFLSTKPIIGCS
jgi:hypothetical protein